MSAAPAPELDETPKKKQQTLREYFDSAGSPASFYAHLSVDPTFRALTPDQKRKVIEEADPYFIEQDDSFKKDFLRRIELDQVTQDPNPSTRAEMLGFHLADPIQSVGPIDDLRLGPEGALAAAKTRSTTSRMDEIDPGKQPLTPLSDHAQRLIDAGQKTAEWVGAHGVAPIPRMAGNALSKIGAIGNGEDDGTRLRPLTAIGQGLKDVAGNLVERGAPATAELRDTIGDIPAGVAEGVTGAPAFLATIAPMTAALGPVGGFAAHSALTGEGETPAEVAGDAAAGAIIGKAFQASGGMASAGKRIAGAAGIGAALPSLEESIRANLGAWSGKLNPLTGQPYTFGLHASTLPEAVSSGVALGALHAASPTPYRPLSSTHRLAIMATHPDPFVRAVAVRQNSPIGVNVSMREAVVQRIAARRSGDTSVPAWLAELGTGEAPATDWSIGPQARKEDKPSAPRKKNPEKSAGPRKGSRSQADSDFIMRVENDGPVEGRPLIDIIEKTDKGYHVGPRGRMRQIVERRADFASKVLDGDLLVGAPPPIYPDGPALPAEAMKDKQGNRVPVPYDPNRGGKQHLLDDNGKPSDHFYERGRLVLLHNGRPIVLGRPSAEDAVFMTASWAQGLSPAQRELAFKWYDDVMPTFREFIPDERVAREFATIFMTANMNDSPAGALAKTVAYYRSQYGHGLPFDKGAFDSIVVQRKLMESFGNLGSMTPGIAPKLSDFSDSMRPGRVETRSWMGHDKRAGAPFTGDLWEARGFGFLDEPFIAKLRDTFKNDPVALRELSKLQTNFSGGPNEFEYEYIGDAGRKASEIANKVKLLGRSDWHEKPFQATHWAVMRMIAGETDPIASIRSILPKLMAPGEGSQWVGNHPRRGTGVEFHEVTHEEFSKARDAYAARNPDKSGFLTFHTLDQMKADGMRVFLSSDGRTGAGVAADGDFRNLFSDSPTKGAGKRLASEMFVRYNADHLDAFDVKGLTNIYRDLGLVETRRQRWNDEHRPDNWNEDLYGKPDVIDMKLDVSPEAKKNVDWFVHESTVRERNRLKAEGKPDKAYELSRRLMAEAAVIREGRKGEKEAAKLEKQAVRERVKEERRAKLETKREGVEQRKAERVAKSEAIEAEKRAKAAARESVRGTAILRKSLSIAGRRPPKIKPRSGPPGGPQPMKGGPPKGRDEPRVIGTVMATPKGRVAMAPPGRCFGGARKWARLNPENDPVVIHGKLTVSGERFDHGWVENRAGELDVVDPSVGYRFSRSEFYWHMKPEVDAIYTADQAYALGKLTGHQGPYTAEEAAGNNIFHNGEPPVFAKGSTDHLPAGSTRRPPKLTNRGGPPGGPQPMKGGPPKPPKRDAQGNVIPRDPALGPPEESELAPRGVSYRNVPTLDPHAPTPPVGPDLAAHYVYSERFDQQVERMLDQLHNDPTIGARIESLRGGKQTIAQIQARAEGLPLMNYEETKPGTVLPASRQAQLSMLVQTAAEHVRNIGDAIKTAETLGAQNEIRGLQSQMVRSQGTLARLLMADSIAGSEWGRSGRMRRASLTPTEQYTRRALRMIMEDTHLTPERQAELTNQVVAAGNNLDAIRQAVYRAYKPTWLEKLSDYAQMAKLTGFGTPVRNFGGNAILLGEKLLHDSGMTVIDGFADRFRPAARRSGASPHEIIADFVGATRGFFSGLREGLRAMRDLDYAVTSGRMSAEGMKLPAMESYLGKKMYLAGQANTAMDTFFYEMNRGSEAYRLAYREAAKTVRGYRARTDMMEQLAQDSLAIPWQRRAELAKNPGLAKDTAERIAAVSHRRAREYTLQEPLGTVGSWMNKPRTWAGNRGAVARLVVPYFPTPANLLKQAWRNAPLLSVMSPKFWSDVRAGGDLRTEAMSRALTAHAVGASLVWMAMQGYITGSGPRDKSARDQLEATGWKPYSFHIGDTYIPFMGFSPATEILAVSTAIADMIKTNGHAPIGELLARTSAGIMRSWVSQPYLTGPASILTSIINQDGTTAVSKAGRTSDQMIEAALVPRMLSSIARGLDPTRRAMPDSLADRFAQDMPWSRADQLPFRDMYGRTYDQVMPWLATVVPISKDHGNDTLDQWMWSLRDDDNHVPVRYPARSYLDRPLDQEGWDKLLEGRGRRLLEKAPVGSMTLPEVMAEAKALGGTKGELSHEELTNVISKVVSAADHENRMEIIPPLELQAIRMDPTPENLLAVQTLLSKPALGRWYTGAPGWRSDEEKRGAIGMVVTALKEEASGVKNGPATQALEQEVRGQ